MTNLAFLADRGMARARDLAKDHLIVALDVRGLEEARAVVRLLGDQVTHFKVGPHLFEDGLIVFIQQLIKDGKKVFLDFKSVDIGDTMRRMAGRVADLGVDFITVMGSTSTIIAAKDGREDSSIPKILAVTLLTDHSEADMQAEYGTTKSLRDFVIDRAIMAAKAGADGVVCSPREVADIRAAVPRPGFLIVTPGIRPAGSPSDDQKRTATPGEAIAAGADYLVIGRPIIRELNRCAASAERILDEMQAALDAR